MFMTRTTLFFLAGIALALLSLSLLSFIMFYPSCSESQWSDRPCTHNIACIDHVLTEWCIESKTDKEMMAYIYSITNSAQIPSNEFNHINLLKIKCPVVSQSYIISVTVSNIQVFCPGYMQHVKGCQGHAVYLY